MSARLLEIVRERSKTDYVMPVWLPFVGYLLIIIGVILLAAGMVAGAAKLTTAAMGGAGLGVALLLIGAVIEIYVIYKWIDRRNKHFQRSHDFFREIERILSGIGSSRADRISTILREMEFDERRRSPAVWVVLSILVPLVAYYVFYFLTKDFHKHSMREAHIIEEAERSLEELGVKIPSRRFRPLPERSAVVYVILTLITGIFGLYWVYVLTKDPNEHFREHLLYEDEIIKSLESLPAEGG